MLCRVHVALAFALVAGAGGVRTARGGGAQEGDALRGRGGARAEHEHAAARCLRALSSTAARVARITPLVERSLAEKCMVLGSLVFGVTLCACCCAVRTPSEAEDQRPGQAKVRAAGRPRTRADTDIPWIDSGAGDGALDAQGDARGPGASASSRRSPSSSDPGRPSRSQRPRAKSLQRGAEASVTRKVSWAPLGEEGPSPTALAAAAKVAMAAREELLEEASDEDYRTCCKELRRLARRLRSPCQKFPKHDGGDRIVSGLKSRYLAVVPAEEDVAGEEAAEDDARRQLQRWRRSRLGYWGDQAAYRQEEPPKGYLPLMQIVKVSRDELATPLEVSVRYREQGGEAHALVLRFETEDQAQIWSQALTELRQLLQQTVTGVVHK